MIKYLLLFGAAIILINSFPNFVVSIVAVVLLIILIRLLADLYWWLKDRGNI